MTEADSLEVIGTNPTTTNISLEINAGGWNLVGYPSAASLALPEALDENGVTEYTLVYAFHAVDTADPWKLFDPSADPFVSDLDQMDPGWGYWIFVTAEADWQIDY